MPCSDSGGGGFIGGYNDPTYLREIEKLNNDLRSMAQDYQSLKNRLDEVTAMLCSTLSSVRSACHPDDFNDIITDATKNCGHDVVVWDAEHREYDKKRLIKQIREDFSPEEIKQLKNLFKKDDL